MSGLVALGIGMTVGGIAVIVAAGVVVAIAYFLHVLGVATWGPGRYW